MLGASLERAVASHDRPRPLKLLSPHLARSKLLEQWARRRGPLKKTALTFFGTPMQVVFPERVSMSIYRYGFFEEGLTRVFLELVKPGMVLFDVGAHIGYYSLLAKRLGAEVHAFEPTPATYSLLVENFGDGSAHNVAVYSQTGEVRLAVNDWETSAFNAVTAEGTLAVPSIALDDYVAETERMPDFVKIDVEGAEEAVLLGAQRVLSKANPVVTTEVGDDAERNERTFSLLVGYGYRCFQWTAAGLVQLSRPGKYDWDNLVFMR